MGTTQLEVYNFALGHFGTTRLHPTSGLTENRQDRRELDAVWSQSGKLMLEAGLWRHAIRTVKMTADPNIVPAFGLKYGFARPADFVRLAQFTTDADGIEEDRTYRLEGDIFYTSNEIVYFGYVSNDAGYGGDMGKKSALYAKAWGAQLAELACNNITKDQNLETKIINKRRTFLDEAKRADARDERVKEKPEGTWIKSRFAYPSMRRRGNRM